MSTTPKAPEAYRPPSSELRGGPGSGRMPGGFGMPTEKSKDFKSSPVGYCTACDPSVFW